MKHIWCSKCEVHITIPTDSDDQVVDARRILDLEINDPVTEKLRSAARSTGQFRDERVIVDENEIVVAKRIDYEVNGRKGSYFAFVCGYDDSGWPIVEPTLDDVDEDLLEEVYKLRWEQVNNRSEVSIYYMGVRTGVETVLLILPDAYGSGIFVDNHELRRLAIKQGLFRPFPSSS